MSAPAASGATLAERLGYSAEDRLLIVNCDDLGMSHAANEGCFAAMRDGVAGRAGPLSVRALCNQVLEIAGRELSAEEAWMLAYPRHVLKSGRTGADRALAAYDALSGSPGQRMTRLITAREALFFPSGRPP